MKEQEFPKCVPRPTKPREDYMLRVSAVKRSPRIRYKVLWWIPHCVGGVSEAIRLSHQHPHWEGRGRNGANATKEECSM